MIPLPIGYFGHGTRKKAYRAVWDRVGQLLDLDPSRLGLLRQHTVNGFTDSRQ